MENVVPEALEYLKIQRVGVIAVEMMDGSPHGATVHYVNSENPLIFYFETNREYRKAEALLGREKSRATLVIGFSDEEAKTMQLDGFVELLKPEEKEFFDTIYFDKFPEKKTKKYGGTPIFFKFTPTWWRYSNFKTPEGKKIWES